LWNLAEAGSVGTRWSGPYETGRSYPVLLARGSEGGRGGGKMKPLVPGNKGMGGKYEVR